MRRCLILTREDILVAHHRTETSLRSRRLHALLIILTRGVVTGGIFLWLGLLAAWYFPPGNDSSNILAAAAANQAPQSGTPEVTCTPRSVVTAGYTLTCHPGRSRQPVGSPGSIQSYNPTITVLPDQGGTRYSWPIAGISWVNGPVITGSATVAGDSRPILTHYTWATHPSAPGPTASMISVVIPEGKILLQVDLLVANLK